jgi:hypothetical protein
MKEYILKNYRTRQYAQKTFETQPDYYIVADLTFADNPSKIIDVVAYFGSDEEKSVRLFETKGIPLPETFHKPFYGDFEDVKQDTLLYKLYTDDDAYLGRCRKDEVGSYERNPDGSIRIFNSIRVFYKYNTAYIRTQTNPLLKNYHIQNVSKYLSGWNPQKLAKYKKDYCYIEIPTKNRESPF